MKVSKHVAVWITQRDCCDMYCYGIDCTFVGYYKRQWNMHSTFIEASEKRQIVSAMSIEWLCRQVVHTSLLFSRAATRGSCHVRMWGHWKYADSRCSDVEIREQGKGLKYVKEGRTVWRAKTREKWFSVNRLTPNYPYMGRTAPLTSKRCILCIYSTNIGTDYFKNAL